MSNYHCDKHRQIKIKRGDRWVCPACEPENKMDVPDFMKGLFSGGRVNK